MANWNPETYLKFDQDRLRPALDLMTQITLNDPKDIIDLGCGPGNVTQILKDRWPESHIIGIDSSPDMLAKAKAKYPAITWVQDDVAHWQADHPVDLIFSNACLHWLGTHERLFPKLLESLKPGGVLAVQMPNNFAAPTHQCIGEVLGENHPLCPGSPVHKPTDYYDWLSPHCQYINLWETQYLHQLEGDNPVADWTKGAALRPVLDGLADDQARERFETSYRALIKKAYPSSQDGKTLLPFKRFFLICVK